MTPWRAWAQNPRTARLSVAVNVSARQFRHPDFVDQVLAAIEHTGANPHMLKLELTESMLVVNVEEIIARMNALKTHGVSFSLDDFGTGFSSLSYLIRRPGYQPTWSTAVRAVSPTSSTGTEARRIT